jgi:triacylglycerol lipase
MNFEPATTRFSAANAEALAVAATIAYEANNTTAQRRAEKELGLDQFFETFEHHNFVIDTEGFVAASKQHVVLAFRGTEPGKIKDWATDALAAPSAFRWFFELAPDVGNVHSGFANSLRDSWADNIRKLLKKAGAGTRRTLWITGHSLGGALAVLAGGACTYDPDTLLPVNGLYTFGQPRVGLHDFCNNIEIKFGPVYYRFVNDRDVVPRVPPRAFDYTHVGRLIHFDSNGEPDADSQEQRSFLARAFGTISAVLGDFMKSPELIGDHDMTKGYLACIRNGIQSGTLAAGKKLPENW